ncbi:MAG: hypothetical protein JKP98_15035 [Rhodobacteraceae bacterium]|nr:hypothetical protein [Paracoccaceae bacterium]
MIGVQDRLPDRAAAAAAHLDALYARAGLDHRVLVFDGLDAAVTHPLVRLVLVTTHTDAHRLPVERAAAAGAARLPRQADRGVAGRCRGDPRRRGACRPSDHDGLHPPLRAILDRGGEAGPVGADRQPAHGAAALGHPYSRYLQLWHRNQARSGGALNDKGCHHFDVLNWVAGEARAVRVTAMGGRSGIFAPDQARPNAAAIATAPAPIAGTKRWSTGSRAWEGCRMPAGSRPRPPRIATTPASIDPARISTTMRW